MKLSKGLNIALQGERFTQLVSGFDFNNTSQIDVLLYGAYTDEGFVKSWVKTPDAENYPEAGTVEFDPISGKSFFEVDTTDLEIGRYGIEIRVDFAGLIEPIDKEETEYLQVKKSRT